MGTVNEGYADLPDRILKQKARLLEKQISAFDEVLKQKIEFNMRDHYYSFDMDSSPQHSKIFNIFPKTRKECKQLKKIIDKHIKDSDYPFLIKSKVIRSYSCLDEAYMIKWTVYLERKPK
jgi:hypothetical protein